MQWMRSKRLPNDALSPSVSESKILSSLYGMVEDTRITTEPRDLGAHGEWREFKKRLICFQTRLKTAGAPLFANTMLAWLISKKIRMLSGKLAQARGGAQPLMPANILLAWWASKTTRRLLSKLADGLKQRGGWGCPPPFANGWLQKRDRVAVRVRFFALPQHH